MFNPLYRLNEIERSNGATQYPQYGDELATEILNERWKTVMASQTGGQGYGYL